MSAPHRRLRRAAPRRTWVDHALTVTLVVAVAAAALVLVGRATGYQALTERSDSMAPTLRAGDLLVNRAVPVARLQRGDVVTFLDATRGRERVTHRVIELSGSGSTLDVVTRGDANTGQEKWTAAASSEVGVLVARVPVMGRAITTMTSTSGALLGVSLAALLGALAIGRRVWGLR